MHFFNRNLKFLITATDNFIIRVDLSQPLVRVLFYDNTTVGARFIMSNINQRKRRHKRFDVYWEALLEIESEEYHKYIPVPLVNMSRSGVLLYTENIAYNNHHLAVAGHNDELNLIIHTPARELDSKIAVKRYSWDDERNAFAVGVEFKKTCEKNKEFTSWLVKNIRHYHQPVYIPDECMAYY